MEERTYRRRFKRIDMMLTAHSVLRDRYQQRSNGLTLGVVAFSAVSLVLTLADLEDRVVVFGIDLAFRTVVAALAASTFFIGMTDLVVDWRKRAWAHDDAAKRLAEVKALFAQARVRDGRRELEGVDLEAAYDRTMAAISPIPDRAFNELKARHLRKVEISRRLDSRPGARPWLLRLQLFFEGLRPPAPSNQEQAKKPEWPDEELA
jgi:hypothetical protein